MRPGSKALRLRVRCGVCGSRGPRGAPDFPAADGASGLKGAGAAPTPPPAAAASPQGPPQTKEGPSQAKGPASPEGPFRLQQHNRSLAAAQSTKWPSGGQGVAPPSLQWPSPRGGGRLPQHRPQPRQRPRSAPSLRRARAPAPRCRCAPSLQWPSPRGGRLPQHRPQPRVLEVADGEARARLLRGGGRKREDKKGGKGGTE